MMESVAVLTNKEVVAAVDTNFIALCRSSKEALKSATLLKSLPVNALILGESGVGKFTLAKFITDAPVVSGENHHDLVYAIEQNESVMIKDFHLIAQPKSIKTLIDEHKTHIIATASTLSENLKDDFFSVVIDLPPLSSRLNDAKELAQVFIKEANELFSIDAKLQLKAEDLKKYLDKNAISLKRFIYGYALTHTLSDEQFISISKFFLKDKLGSGDDYRKLLPLFDVSLIRAGFEKFGSQLSMSEAFGLNRNTLRKKINENIKYFEEE